MTMNRQRTLKQYRMIDLAFFALMLLVAEYLIVRAANHWFPAQPYTVSVAAAIVSLVYMRWGWWGGIHAVLAGLVFCFFSSGCPWSINSIAASYACCIRFDGIFS